MFPSEVPRHWLRLPGEATGAQNPVFQGQAGWALGSLSWSGATSPWQELELDLYAPFQAKSFYDSVNSADSPFQPEGTKTPLTEVYQSTGSSAGSVEA